MSKSCGCSYCESNRTISTLRQAEPTHAVRHNNGKYPKRSKKVWEDRIKAQEAVVKRYEEWEARTPNRWWIDSLQRAREKLVKIKLEAKKYVDTQTNA